MISVSDLYSPTVETWNQPVSLLKDITDKKSFIFDDQICLINDVNILCKISPISSNFHSPKAFSAFVCMFYSENLEDNLELFKLKMELKHKNLHTDDVAKIVNISRNYPPLIYASFFSGSHMLHINMNDFDLYLST